MYPSSFYSGFRYMSIKIIGIYFKFLLVFMIFRDFLF